jgi:hypothetical protein
MKTAFYITLILLIGSIIYIFTLQGQLDESSMQLESCEASLEPYLPEKGYDFVDTIKWESAKSHADYFQNIADASFDSISGGVLSVEALLAMLLDSEVKPDGITYKICMDTSGTVIDKKYKGLYVVFNPVKLNYDEIAQTWSQIPIGAKYYISRHWCPPLCMSFESPDRTGTAPAGDSRE